MEIILPSNQRLVRVISTCRPLKDSACASLIALDNCPVEHLSQLCLKLSNRMRRQAFQQASQQAPDARPYYTPQSLPSLCLLSDSQVQSTSQPLPCPRCGLGSHNVSLLRTRAESPCNLSSSNPETRPFTSCNASRVCRHNDRRPHKSLALLRAYLDLGSRSHLLGNSNQSHMVRDKS